MKARGDYSVEPADGFGVDAPRPVRLPGEVKPSSRVPSGCDVSIVVPTFCEAENLPILIGRIACAMSETDYQYEIVLVDDNSNDGTEEAIRSLAEYHPVRLEVRRRERGLSSAVLHGIRHSRGAMLVVMDADLSHPPESVPKLLEALEEERTEFVIGSRYIAGGGTDESWGLFRSLNSRAATLLARPFTRAKDPMAGFFALRRTTFEQAESLDPIGYKIGLELMVKCDVRNFAEIPIHFSDRRFGESKLSLKEQINYLRHLGRLLAFKAGRFLFRRHRGMGRAAGKVG